MALAEAGSQTRWLVEPLGKGVGKGVGNQGNGPVFYNSERFATVARVSNPSYLTAALSDFATLPRANGLLHIFEHFSTHWGLYLVG